MKLETVEPSHTSLSSLGGALEYLMPGNPQVVTDLELSGINKGNTRWLSLSMGEARTEGSQHTLHKLKHARIADQLGEFTGEKAANKLNIVGFEVPVAGLMEEDNNSHHFTDKEA